ncbi:MAG: diacylglycerol kinase family protein [Clostridia bacterium]|nr:diacylglycerol kinase family protein [Clostridia bacterium]
MTYVFYNPLSNNHQGKPAADQMIQSLSAQKTELLDITKQENIADFLCGLEKTDKVIIVGGDGTLNHLVNDLDGKMPQVPIYAYPAGSGNDFFGDVKDKAEDGMVLFNPYMADLPTVRVNGMKRRFLNGIGYGIDGYCCEVGDQLKEKSDKPVNYAGIAIKGLLFHYKPTKATIEVDGKTFIHEKTWLSPTMNGRFYGGGMNIAPQQDRLNKEHTQSVCVFHGSGKLKTLILFPGIFKGELIKHEKYFKIYEGREVTVRFDRPVALQIDGETVLNVTEYSVSAKVPATV